MASPEVTFTICRRTTASPYHILKSLFMRAIPHSHLNGYISGNISSPFTAKNAFVTAYLLKSSLARLKKWRVPFLNYFVFAKL